MDAEDAFEVFLTVAFLIGILIAVGSTMAVPRERHDWIMIAGSLLGTLGVGLLLLVIHGDLFQSNTAAFVIMGILGLGIMLFSMGFLYDQLRTRRILRLRQQFEQLPPEAHGP